MRQLTQTKGHCAKQWFFDQIRTRHPIPTLIHCIAIGLVFRFKNKSLTLIRKSNKIISRSSARRPFVKYFGNVPPSVHWRADNTSLHPSPHEVLVFLQSRHFVLYSTIL